MTDAEKLDRVKKFVEDMAPVVRAAILVPEPMASFNRGWDAAAYTYQQQLLRMLND